MKKIFLCGLAHGSYRNQNTIKFLTDNINDYAVSYTDSRFFNSSMTCKTFLCKLMKKLINFFINLLVYPYEIFKIFNSDIIFVLAMNHQNNFVKIWIAKLLRKEIILDFYISYYDSLVLDTKTVTNKYKIKQIFFKEKTVAKLADKLIFLNNSEAKYYSELLNLDLKEKYIVPLCVDEHKHGQITLSKDTDKIPIVCWWGSYIALHGLTNIIDAVQVLINRNFKCKFYLFGNSDEKAKEYILYIKEKKLESYIKVLNDFSFNNGKLENFLVQNCDLALGSFGESNKAKTVLINKVIDSISMKIPLLTIRTKALEEFFDFKNDIYIVNTNNAIEIAEKIIAIFDKYNIAVKNTEVAYQIYKKNFSQSAFNHNLIKVLN